MKIDSEMKRQVFHLMGVLFVVCAYFIPRKPLLLLFLFLVVLSAVLFFLRPLPPHLGFIKKLFDYLHHNLAREAEKKARFYVGSTAYAVSVFLTLWIFDIDIFKVAILVLAVGDSISTIVGKTYGSHRIFYNRDKTWEGTLSGMFASFAACLLVVPVNVAAVAAFVGMAVESAPVGVDDNLTIPFAVALSMLAFL